MGPWTLVLQGFVSGVPTTIWAGIKSVGSCPAGTYMQDGTTPQAATGPGCFTVKGTCTALAWWAMESNPLAEPDSVNGYILDGSFNPIWHTQVAGKVGAFAQRIHCQGFASNFSQFTSDNISLPATGITIACWVNIAYNVSAVGSNLARIAYTFYDPTFSAHTLQAEQVEGGDWIASLDGIGLIHKAFAAGWHFLAITYDPVSGTLGFDVDQAGMSTAPVGAITPIVFAATQIHVDASTTLTGVGNMDADYDELALFDGVLSSYQLDWIYNSGAGKTWPI